MHPPKVSFFALLIFTTPLYKHEISTSLSSKNNFIKSFFLRKLFHSKTSLHLRNVRRLNNFTDRQIDRQTDKLLDTLYG